ncbi:class I SAM-dependent methyltransferase [Pseudomonas sp. PDM14]|uniref:class I SAM-dependent methyltransferase n=1 Tax=Pseudomonas sp. PDM14 TaxID=2769288 RepID=UPI001785E45B|nr:class I SAM-dependent methyltransferase [Pseudomonas sp. PDM14]MBD9482126.1 class I SAM-dependent methyltransferase [Pseudomonas sp. PDM14]
MPLWNEGYLAESVYPHHVQGEMSPSWLSAVLTALGQRAPDVAQPFRYCELGCGQGLNALLLAASNPCGQFVAVDFNAQHIAHGRRQAQAAGLSNLEFLQADFASLAAQPPGEGFDFIVLHGVYSWVSPANRQALRRFIALTLKPGGVVYLGYMSHPGLSAFASAQRLIWQTAQAASGNEQQRLRAGLDALAQWQAAGAGYFVDHPDVARRLARQSSEDLGYLAHELLCEHWAPQHAAEVIADFAAIDCRFVGSATPLENIDELSLPAGCLSLLQGLDDPAQRETAKDIARNQAQRRDLYLRQAQALTASEHRQALLGSCWAVLPGAPADGPVLFDTRIGPVEGDVSLYGPLLQALGEGPQSFAELARRPQLSGQIGLLSGALQLLTWAGHAHPLRAGAVDVACCQRVNRVLAEGALHGSGYTHLAAPSLGAGIAANTLEMASARVLLEHPALRGSLLHETVLALLRRTGHGFDSDVATHLQRFEAVTLPVWQRLGVV